MALPSAVAFGAELKARINVETAMSSWPRSVSIDRECFAFTHARLARHDHPSDRGSSSDAGQGSGSSKESRSEMQRAGGRSWQQRWCDVVVACVHLHSLVVEIPVAKVASRVYRS
jgi:hypothetical protein